MEGNGKARRIESWRAIAEYLGKDVTTAIRWEREKGLPVHRQTEGKRQIVFAYSTEIEHWRLHGSASTQPVAETHGGPGNNNGVPLADHSTSTIGAVRPEQPRARTSGFETRTAVLIILSTVLIAGVATLYMRVSFRHQVRSANQAEIFTFAFPESVLSFRKSVIPLHGRGDMHAADLNGDGAMDLVIGNFPANGVQVLLGKGNGTFAPIQIYQGCPAAHGLDVADLDGDGVLDIVSTCYDDESLAIWWGSGGGTFDAIPTRLAVGRKPMYARVADLNHDGLPDIVADATGGSGISVLVNQGHREFTRHNYELGFSPRRIAIVDFDGDGKLDVLTGCMGESCQVTRMLKGNGDGSFRIELFPSFGEFIIDVVPLESGGAKPLVLAVVGRDVKAQDWKLLLVPTLPPGRSAAPVLLKRASGPMYIIWTDLDGDSEEELAVACAWTNELSFLKRTNRGYVESSVRQIDRYVYYLVTGDFNKDGRTDLVFTSWDSNGPNLTMLLQTDRATTPRQ